MVKPIITLIILTGGLSFAGHAQTVALFSIDQPPKFEADAGDDLVYEAGLTLQVSATGGTGTYSYLWSPSEYLDDPTSPTPQVQGILSASLFTVQVTDLGLGCTLTDDVLVDFTTGIPAMSDAALNIFPNPTDGSLRIQAPVAIQHVQLRSLNGALAMEYGGMAMRELVLDVSALPAGVYSMNINLIDGRSHTHKLCATTAH